MSEETHPGFDDWSEDKWNSEASGILDGSIRPAAKAVRFNKDTHFIIGEVKDNFEPRKNKKTASLLEEMSKEEIEAAREELIQKLDPKTIQFLLNRSKSK